MIKGLHCRSVFWVESLWKYLAMIRDDGIRPRAKMKPMIRPRVSKAHSDVRIQRRMMDSRSNRNN